MQTQGNPGLVEPESGLNFGSLQEMEAAGLRAVSELLPSTSVNPPRS